MGREQVIVINGGGGQIEIRDGSDLLMPQGTVISKKNRIINNAEETKINFFDPNVYAKEREEEEEMEANQKDQVDHEILEGKIDPGEWKKEIERMYLELDNIEKEIELSRQRGSSGVKGVNIGTVDQGVEECRRHIELIIELCTDIKGTCHQDVRKVFAKVAEKLEEDQNFIRKHELRINQNNALAIQELNGIT